MFKLSAATIFLFITVFLVDAGRLKRSLFKRQKLTTEGKFWLSALDTWDKLDNGKRLQRFGQVTITRPSRIENWNYVLTGNEDEFQGYNWAIEQLGAMVQTRNLPNYALNQLVNMARAVVSHRQGDLRKFNGGNGGHQYVEQQWRHLVSIFEDKLNRRGQNQISFF
ncbi:hypothetical protein HDE_09277 [Halotydeus destructor]|nr:hypothetical protein HDE_09277 [Halotydeus destructor]